jgi:hypothetical protein
MDKYTKIPIWENLRRIAKLKQFRKLVKTYFSGISYPNYGETLVSNKANEARPLINRMSSEISSIVSSSNESTKVIHYPAPAIGGFVTKIDLIENIFNLEDYDIEPDVIIDCIDKSIGVYEYNKTQSIFRTINPVYWFGRLFTFIATVPFRLLTSAGFQTQKVEHTFLGKFIGLFFQIVIALGALLTILQILGYNNLISFIRKVIDVNLR